MVRKTAGLCRQMNLLNNRDKNVRKLRYKFWCYTTIICQYYFSVWNGSLCVYLLLHVQQLADEYVAFYCRLGWKIAVYDYSKHHFEGSFEGTRNYAAVRTWCPPVSVRNIPPPKQGIVSVSIMDPNFVCWNETLEFIWLATRDNMSAKYLLSLAICSMT